MGVRGICKVRNEAHIISDTLDNWGEICDQGIHVYDDNSTDCTVQLCQEHLAVAEVITSDCFDPDRERAEWYCRSTVLRSARRFMQPEDWVVYFDADEHVEEFDTTLLERSDLNVISLMSFDVYVTEEDKDISEWHYKERRYVSPEFQIQPYFYRNSLPMDFVLPDQRNLQYSLPDTEAHLTGKVRHWGKGLSTKKWDEKCAYYAYIFGPKYAEKWRARMGQAVHEVSDFGNPLVLWDDILSGAIEPMWTRVQAEGVPVT